jgi:hypothetical protein
MKAVFSIAIVVLLVAVISCIGTLEGTIWIEHASGYQCSAPEFPTIQSAAQELTSAGITPIRMKEVYFPTCLACSCPNGLIYQALIKEEDLEKSESLGWSRVP